MNADIPSKGSDHVESKEDNIQSSASTDTSYQKALTKVQTFFTSLQSTSTKGVQQQLITEGRRGNPLQPKAESLPLRRPKSKEPIKRWLPARVRGLLGD